MDVDLLGCKYTWISNPRDGERTRQKIHRFLANWFWRGMFPHAMVTAMPIVNSDHSPLILKLVPAQANGVKFKYEAFWETDEGCRDVVRSS